MSDQFEVVTSQLRFPEGPVALSDGSVLVVEIERGTLSRVDAGGNIDVVANLGGGPNGAAIGPDGHCYVCNNGGFEWVHRRGRTYPGNQASDYTSGRIERVNLTTGDFDVVYDSCDGVPLCGPNDIVFDSTGGFWFTDHGKNRPRERDRTGVFYAKPDGSSIKEVIWPLEAPNGIGLSPNQDVVYIAETPTARLWAYPLKGPGQLQGDRLDRPDGGRVVHGRMAYCMYDSLAVDAEGEHLRCNPDGWRNHRPFSRRRADKICSHAGSLDDQYLFRRGRLENCLYHSVVNWAASQNAVGHTGNSTEFPE